MSEELSETLLAPACFPFLAEHIVDSLAEAQSAASELGWSVVLKANTDQIAHKPDAGHVKTGVTDPARLAEAFTEIQNGHCLATGTDRVRIKVVENLDSGVEVMCGILMDLTFGPVVSVARGNLRRTACRLRAAGMPARPRRGRADDR